MDGLAAIEFAGSAVGAGAGALYGTAAIEFTGAAVGRAFVQLEAEETSRTAGTDRPYILRGAVLGHRSFSSVMNDGDRCFYRAYDTVRYERGIAQFIYPNELLPLTIYDSTNAAALVDWPNRGQRIIIIEPAPSEYINVELSNLFIRVKEWVLENSA